MFFSLPLLTRKMRNRLLANIFMSITYLWNVFPIWHVTYIHVDPFNDRCDKWRFLISLQKNKNHFTNTSLIIFHNWASKFEWMWIWSTQQHMLGRFSSLIRFLSFVALEISFCLSVLFVSYIAKNLRKKREKNTKWKSHWLRK